jgi:hypothetical protein
MTSAPPTLKASCSTLAQYLSPSPAVMVDWDRPSHARDLLGQRDAQGAWCVDGVENDERGTGALKGAGRLLTA